MKKLVAVLLLCAGVGHAVEPATVNKSSAITAVNGTGYLPSNYLDTIMIGMATSGGVLEVYNATASVHATAATLISSVSLATVGYRDFSNLGVKGIFWRASTNTNGVTILYKN